MSAENETWRIDEEPPDSTELFHAIRDYLRRARTDKLVLRGPDGLYMALDESLPRMAASIEALAEWERQKGRAPDVMADSGEIITEFEQIYPPPYQPH